MHHRQKNRVTIQYMIWNHGCFWAAWKFTVIVCWKQWMIQWYEGLSNISSNSPSLYWFIPFTEISTILHSLRPAQRPVRTYFTESDRQIIRISKRAKVELRRYVRGLNKVSGDQSKIRFGCPLPRPQTHRHVPVRRLHLNYGTTSDTRKKNIVGGDNSIQYMTVRRRDPNFGRLFLNVLCW